MGSNGVLPPPPFGPTLDAYGQRAFEADGGGVPWHPDDSPRRAAVLLLALLTVVAAGGPAETLPRGRQHRAAAPYATAPAPSPTTTATQLGEGPPASLCGGRVERSMGPDLEVAYHHYHDRRGVDLPQTARLLARQRPGGTDDLFVAWGTLTRAAGPC